MKENALTMAWNEPGSGKNNQNQNPWNRGGKNQGPPDLDQIIKKFFDKLKASLKGGLQHVPRNAGVLANQHRRVRLGAAQHLAYRMAQPQHEVGRDGRLADRATNAVGSEILSAHGRCNLRKVGNCRVEWLWFAHYFCEDHPQAGGVTSLPPTIP